MVDEVEVKFIFIFIYLFIFLVDSIIDVPFSPTLIPSLSHLFWLAALLLHSQGILDLHIYFTEHPRLVHFRLQTFEARIITPELTTVCVLSKCLLNTVNRMIEAIPKTFIYCLQFFLAVLIKVSDSSL